MLKVWKIKMAKTTTETLKQNFKSNDESRHLGNVKVKLFWSLKHLVKESNVVYWEFLKLSTVLFTQIPYIADFTLSYGKKWQGA